MKKAVRVELVLTCRILRLGKLDKGPESKTAHYCDHETNGEHGHDLELLLCRHVQL
jgi:hypothetical protein